AGPLHPRVPRGFSAGPMRALSGALYALQSASGVRRWDQYRRGLQLLSAIGDPCRFYLILRNAWDLDRGAYRLYGPAWRGFEPETTTERFAEFFRPRGARSLEQALRAEMRTKMVDDFLLNEDRVSMAHGLEVRVPFLDRDLVRYAATIPAGLKIRRQQTKWLFRRAVAPLLPPRATARAKRGFHFDALDRFRKDLRPLARRVLTRQRVEERGWFDYGFLREILDHPPHPRMRWHYYMLWLALGLEIWARLFLEGDMRRPELELEALFP
ncbi:MAG: asparagine synthase C-terminal domain-containing protein, partial [Acidobacteriota bacterium]